MPTREEQEILNGGAPRVALELLAERNRQIAEEGWTPKHDERHVADVLALAGAAYAMSAATHQGRSGSAGLIAAAATYWPLWEHTFKPKDQRRDLVRAGALIIAAIERHDREAAVNAFSEEG